jgi:hypothetical protein
MSTACNEINGLLEQSASTWFWDLKFERAAFVLSLCGSHALRGIILERYHVVFMLPLLASGELQQSRR